MAHPVVPKELMYYSYAVFILLIFIAALYGKIKRDQIEEILWTLGFGLVYPFFWIVVVLPPALPYWLVFGLLIHQPVPEALPLLASAIGGMITFLPLLTWIYILHRKSPKAAPAHRR